MQDRCEPVNGRKHRFEASAVRLCADACGPPPVPQRQKLRRVMSPKRFSNVFLDSSEPEDDKSSSFRPMPVADIYTCAMPMPQIPRVHCRWLVVGRCIVNCCVAFAQSALIYTSARLRWFSNVCPATAAIVPGNDGCGIGMTQRCDTLPSAVSPLMHLSY